MLVNKILGYKNTCSMAGNAKSHTIDPVEIETANVWFNSDCNAVYKLYMNNGDTYLTMSVGAINGANVFRNEVKRKKEL